MKFNIPLYFSSLTHTLSFLCFNLCFSNSIFHINSFSRKKWKRIKDNFICFYRYIDKRNEKMKIYFSYNFHVSKYLISGGKNIIWALILFSQAIFVFKVFLISFSSFFFFSQIKFTFLFMSFHFNKFNLWGNFLFFLFFLFFSFLIIRGTYNKYHLNIFYVMR